MGTQTMIPKLLSRLKNKNEIATIATEKDRYYDEFVRTITPSMIKEFEDYIEIYSDGDMCYATCIVVGVPPTQTGRGFPKNLPADFTDQVLAVKPTGDCLIGVSYSCSPIAHEESQKLVDDALFNNKISRSEIDKKTHEDSGTSAHSLRYDLESDDYVDIFHTIYNNESRLCDTQYIITLWAKTYDGLKNGISKIKGVMDTNVAKMDVPYHCILEAFLAAQPYPVIMESAEIQQLSKDCGMLIPLRNPLTSVSDSGIIYGMRKLDGAPFIIDWASLAAAHHLILGSSGSGKTVLLMKILMAGYSMLGWHFFYITPKRDSRTNYLAVAEHYGPDQASVINIGKNKDDQNINPLQVMIDSDISQITNEQCIDKFNDHLDLVMSCFRTLETTDIMTNYVHESLMEVYRHHGIVRKDPATWKNLPGDKWPVLLDLREIWKGDARDKNVSAIAMVGRTTWLETTCEYISKPTDVSFNKPITIVDLSGVPGVLQSFMNVLVVGLIGARFNTPHKKPTMVIIDEGRVFLNDAKISELIMRLFTQGRSEELYAVFTTQQAGDISTDESKELMQNNSFVKIAMGNAQPQSYQMTQSFFGLSDENMGEYAGCGQGQGLAMVHDTVTAVDFKLTDLEAEVILGKKIPGSITSVQGGFELTDGRLRALAEDNHAYIEEWVKGDSKVLSPGRDRFPVQRAFRSGTTGIWIESSMVSDNKILNQTVDHYGTVLQIASYLLHRGFSVEVNHHDDADVVATMNGKTIAIEYERPRSHTVNQLIDKNQRWQTKYGHVLFVVTSENYKLVSAENCIGQQKTMKRGAMLQEYIENYIYELNQDTIDLEVV